MTNPCGCTESTPTEQVIECLNRRWTRAAKRGLLVEKTIWNCLACWPTMCRCPDRITEAA